MKMFRLVVLIVSVSFSSMQCGSDDSAHCPTATCDEYLSQSAAQAAFDADKTCMKDLDDDHDGIACEHLSGGGGGTTCPTTGNCGCSGKNKAECGGDCCKWIVGTGCKCK
jgi:hypothetical protein